MAVVSEPKAIISEASELEYLRSILQKIPGNVFWKKTNGQYLGCNETVAKILNLSSPKEIIGKTNFDLFGEQSALPLEAADKEVIRSAKTLQTEEKGINEKGAVTYYLTTRTPIYNQKNEIIGILGSAVDITNIKEAEAKLLESNQALQKLDKLKTQFIENMQHDLRTPLTGLYAIMNILCHEKNKDAERAELFQLGFSAAEELLHLLDEFVSIHHYDEGIFHLKAEAFPLKEMVDSIINLESLSIRQKKLSLHYHYDFNCPEIIISDKYRLRGILLNILSNAIKFTHQGAITVEVGIEIQNEQSFLLFNVKDSGIGIAKADQEIIFEKFKKIIPSNTDQYKGMGTGLYFAHRFLTDLQGQIHLTSELGKGSEFLWKVPIKMKPSFV